MWNVVKKLAPQRLFGEDQSSKRSLLSSLCSSERWRLPSRTLEPQQRQPVPHQHDHRETPWSLFQAADARAFSSWQLLQLSKGAFSCSAPPTIPNDSNDSPQRRPVHGPKHTQLVVGAPSTPASLSRFTFSTGARAFSATTVPQHSHSHCWKRAFSSALPTNDDPDHPHSSNTIPFLLADIGEGIKEVELLQWFVAVGDTVQQFDKICEVQSDKATVEITSRYDGLVTSLNNHQTGDMIQVGQPLLFLETATASDGGASKEGTRAAPSSDTDAPTNTNTDEITSAASGKLDPTAAVAPNEPLHIPTVASQFHLRGDVDETTTTSSSSVLTSPAVRKLAREYNIDLATIKGRGPQGRVLKSDVMTYLKEQGLWRGSAAADVETGISASATIDSSAAPSAATTRRVESNKPEDEIVQLRGYHRLMVKSMTAALQTPHMGFGDEIVCNELLECRKQLNLNSGQSDVKISVLALLVKAVSAALTRHPTVNAVVHSVENCEFQIRRDHNIGIAMDTPRGLVVPVLKQCQRLSVTEIQHELDRLKHIAAEGNAKFAEDDLTDPTFTLSNIGSVAGSGTYMQPVLAPPALAMGALGRIKTLPRFVSEEHCTDIYAAQILTVSWCADHRFLDGATLARFHRQFQEYVEHPVRLLTALK